MPYLIAGIPRVECFVRREFTRNLQDRHGQFLPGIAHTVRCMRGRSLWFWVTMKQPEDGQPNITGGTTFWLPIEAICHQPCLPASLEQIQPWGMFSSDFGVAISSLHADGDCLVLPERVPAKYQFSLSCAGKRDAEHNYGQPRTAHLMLLEGGLIGAYPGSRLVFQNKELWEATEVKPDYVSWVGNLA